MVASLSRVNRRIRHTPEFWIGFLIRGGLLFFFGSSYLKDLFIPFLDASVLSPGANPWSLMSPDHFPYGGVLFLILFIPRFLAFKVIGAAALGSGPLGLALVKGPMLVLDLLLFSRLARIAGERGRALLWFYWLNPVLIFVTYVHGQLDVASTAFLVLSLEQLIRKRTILSAVTMAAATLCKFHVVIAVPLAMVYMWNTQFSRNALRNIATWVCVWAAICFLGFLPLIQAQAFLYASASSPEAMRVLGSSIDYGSGHTLYLGVLLISFALGRICLSTRISERGLIYGAGALFGSLLLATSPAPGWFYWYLPFLSLLFASHFNAPRTLFVALIGSYFLYFCGPTNLSNLSFTLLQTSVAGSLVALWGLALSSECQMQKRGEPIFLGLAGDSGSGKNFLSHVLRDLFSPARSLLIEGDDYHRWEREDERWERYTHLDPRANNLFSMAQDATRVGRGLSVSRSHYDHETGRFTASRELRPNAVVLLQGLHTLYLRSLRSRFDLKIYLNPHPLVRLYWKIKRDSSERGHSAEKVLSSMQDREADSDSHIRPQRELADWIVEYFPVGEYSEQMATKGEAPRLSLRCIIWNDVQIAPLLDNLRRLGATSAVVTSVANDINRVAIEFTDAPSAEIIGAVAYETFPNIRHITRGRVAPCWRNGYEGLQQLIAVALLGAPRFGGPKATV